MKPLLYTLIAVGSLLATLPVSATRRPLASTTATRTVAEAGSKALGAAPASLLSYRFESPFRKSSKKPNRAVLGFSGYEKNKSTMSPLKRDWRLHVHQNHVQTHALRQARSRRAHWQR